MGRASRGSDAVPVARNPFLRETRMAQAFADLLDGHLAPENAPRQVLALTGVVGALAAFPVPPVPSSVAAGGTSLAAAVTSTAGTAAGTAASTAGTGAAPAGVMATKAVALKAGFALPAWVGLASGSAVIAVLAGGVVAATHLAQPGDAFYGLKQQVERVQVGLTGTSADAARERLAQAQTRMDEVTRLASALPAAPTPDQLERIHAVLVDWADLVTRATGPLTTTVAGAQQLGAFLTDQAVLTAQLSQLYPRLPAADSDLISAVLRRTSAAITAVAGLLAPAVPGQLPAPTSPGNPALPVAPVTPVTPGRSGVSPAAPVSPATGPASNPAPTTSPRASTSGPASPAPALTPPVLPSLPGGLASPVPSAGVPSPVLPSAAPPSPVTDLTGLLGVIASPP
jgi:hypothetical protein